MGTSPVCNDNEHTCRGCSSHDECAASDVCLPSGACADANDVAYVSASGTGTTCTQASPCNTVTAGLGTNRPYVKITGTIDEAITINGSRTVTLLGAPGAKLTRTNNGSLLRVEDSAHVSIYDLEISGALGSNVGISVPVASSVTLALTRVTVQNNAGGGISASSGTLTVSQSTISGNAGGGITASGGTLTVSQSTLSGNAGGGISLSSSAFDISNSFIIKNGGLTSTFGGVLINGSNTGTRRLAFNTVTRNGGPDNAVTGVTCVLVNQPVTFSNTIVYGNQVNGTGSQVGGTNCNWTYSDVGPQTVSGTGNVNADPQFVNATQDDFHLTSGSPAQDVADPSATLTVDVDGDMRPQGAGRDIGADEYTP
jgi:hypothetical protein